MATVRTFVAVDVPTADQGKLQHLQALLREVPGDVRWSTGPHLHLTLRFLGEIDTALVSKVEEATARAASLVPPFSLQLGGLGLFLAQGHPSVIWVGVRRGVDHLKDLQSLVDEELALAGFPREGRPFSPHLTLGRIRAGERRSWEVAVAAHRDEVSVEFPVREVTVVKSDLTPRGPIYTVLRRAPLKE